MSLESVTVIGGGLAGLSSAVALADAGLRVRLFEKRPHLGGRATSYFLPDGSEIDNCQHVTLGCCTNLADFYRRVGAWDKIRFYERMSFVDKTGRRFGIGPTAFLPPPLHMAPSFFRFAALNWKDKNGIARALLKIALSGGKPPGAAGTSMLHWLHRMNQTPAAIERFWRVVLVSALDEELARSDAQYGIDVFWKAFLANRQGFRMGIPTVPLGALYAECRSAIERRGGEVRLRAVVKRIEVSGDAAPTVILDDESEWRDDALLVTVPQEALLGMLPQALRDRQPVFEALRHLHNSPITGIHFWFDREVMREPFITLLDHTVQWVFNRSVLARPDADGGNGPAADSSGGASAPSAQKAGQYLQLVISASYDLVSSSRQEIIDLCLRELHQVLPATRDAQLVKATVIKEVAATFSPEPGSDQWRPVARTPFHNFFLAGDWTRTGWPATMEGAVRSGYLAAEAILEAAGRPQKFLVPDLPVKGLCRLWAAPTA
jgi:squalene-associated FAD-dependent desaturase